MSESSIVPANPLVSPEFGKARRLSRILAFLLGAGFWLTLASLIVISIAAIWPEGIARLEAVIKGITAREVNIPVPHRAAALSAMVVMQVPVLLVFKHARRVFVSFAEGLVFAAETVVEMRHAAFWLIAAGIVPPRPLLLIFGIATYVAVYVMSEARRIADDNASIV